MLRNVKSARSLVVLFFVAFGLFFGVQIVFADNVGDVVHQSSGDQENCNAYVSQVAPTGTVCFVPSGTTVETQSDVYVSADQDFYSTEFVSGTNTLVGSLYVYAPWGVSFKIISEPTPEPTATITPTVTITPSATPVPTETVVPTTTVVPTATAVPTATPIFVIEGDLDILPNCADFVSVTMASGSACKVSVGWVVSTNSDVYVSSDHEIFATEIITEDGYVIGGYKLVYAEWGASFVVLQTPVTPTPEPTIVPTPQVHTFMPNVVVAPEGPNVVFVFEGQPLNCMDYRTQVAPNGSVCKTDRNLKSNSDLYLSADNVFTEDELHTGGNITVPTGMFIYLPFGGSFFEP